MTRLFTAVIAVALAFSFLALLIAGSLAWLIVALWMSFLPRLPHLRGRPTAGFGRLPLFRSDARRHIGAGPAHTRNGGRPISETGEALQRSFAKPSRLHDPQHGRGAFADVQKSFAGGAKNV